MTAHTSAGIADRSAAPTWMMTPAGAGTAGVAWPSFPQLRARVSRPHSDALVIMVDGDLDAATVDYLQLVLWPRLSATVDTLLVALTGVGFLGVSGLQLLSCAHLRAQTRGVAFGLVLDGGEAERAVRMAGLKQALPCFATVEQAQTVLEGA